MFIFLIVVLSSFALGAEEVGDEVVVLGDDESVGIALGDSTGDGVEDEDNDLKKFSDKISSSTNEALAKEIKVPEKYQVFSKIVFGFKGDSEISLQELIVLMALLVFVILIVHSGVGMFDGFDNLTSWATSIIIVLIGSSSGIFKSAVTFLLGLGDSFKIFTEWSALWVGAVVVLLFLFFYGLSVLGKVLGSEKKKEDIKESAEAAGFELARLERFGKIRNMVRGYGK